MKKNIPLVSIIVHTKNSGRTIKKHLESIKSQSYPSIEIIGVDNFSKDNTYTILKKYSKKVFRKGPERSAQRNYGVKKSSGKYVCIPDSDMVLGKNVISECVELLEKNITYKAAVIPERSVGIGFWASCKALERECYINDTSIEAARFFDKNIFLEMNGYDENITGPEDWDLPQRIKKKYKIGRINTYIVHDEGKVSLLALAKKKYYYALKLSSYISKHKSRKTILQTIYFLRPAFYRNWRKIIRDPMRGLGLIIMLMVEQFAGAVGFLKGRL